MSTKRTIKRRHVVSRATRPTPTPADQRRAVLDAACPVTPAEHRLHDEIRKLRGDDNTVTK